jgi:imidazolonepropionase-like amidohydrolase
MIFNKMINCPQFIYAGWLIDGSGGPVQKKVLIQTDGGYITEIRPIKPADALQDNVLDLSEATVLPGLIDAHLHLFMSGTGDMAVRERQLNAGFEDMKSVISAHLKQLTDCGVIAVRDGGDYGGYALRYKRECLDKSQMSIRVQAAGRAWRKPGRYGRLIGRPTPEGQTLARAVAEDSEPCDHVKIVNSGVNSLSEFGRETRPQFDLEELTTGISAAHDRGLRVMIHCNGRAPVEGAVRAGCDSVEHGFFMGEENMKRMADRGTVWVPTAITMQAYAGELNHGDRSAEVARMNFEHQAEQIARARELGVILAVGTDAGSLGVHHGQAMKQEMAIFIQAGFSITQAVQCAASIPSDLMGLADLGKITRGMAAALIAVPGPPDTLPGSLGNLIFNSFV